jgi:hypothetical protein
MPLPLSITWTNDLPASLMISLISAASESTAFSSSSFTADAWSLNHFTGCYLVGNIVG